MLSYQLYSSRDRGALGRTLAMVAEAGFGAVEGYGPQLDDPVATRAALDAAGLRMPSAHVDIGRLDDPAAVVDMAGALGLSHAFVPFVGGDARPTDADGWRRLAADLARTGRDLADEGVTLGWHNHDFEFRTLPDGSYPVDHLAEAGLALELDIAWIVRAGADPLAWIERLGPKIAAVHVKDLAPAGTTAEDGWADPGHGILDWQALAAALSIHSPALWIAEHDAPSDDTRFARHAAGTMRDLGMGA